MYRCDLFYYLNGELDMLVEYTENGLQVGGKYLSLDEITHNVLLAKAKKNNLALMSIVWPAHRNFNGVYEHIVLPESNLIRIKEIIGGHMIYFGEIEGKHSDVYGEVELDEITISKDEKTLVDFLKKHPNGHDTNHSFLGHFMDYAYDGEYEGLSDDLIQELDDIIYNV